MRTPEDYETQLELERLVQERLAAKVLELRKENDVLRGHLSVLVAMVENATPHGAMEKVRSYAANIRRSNGLKPRGKG